MAVESPWALAVPTLEALHGEYCLQILHMDPIPVLCVTRIFSILKVVEWKKGSAEAGPAKTPIRSTSGRNTERKHHTRERTCQAWLFSVLKKYPIEYKSSFTEL